MVLRAANGYEAEIVFMKCIFWNPERSSGSRPIGFEDEVVLSHPAKRHSKRRMTD